MLPMAVSEAVASVDKGFDRSAIEAAWFGELVPTDGFASGILADSCGLLDIPVSHLENACATGNDAVRHGFMGVASGLYDVVLVVGADKVRETSSQATFWDWMSMTRDMAWDFPLGLVAPANFALHAWSNRSGCMTALPRVTGRPRCSSSPRKLLTDTQMIRCGFAALA